MHNFDISNETCPGFTAERLALSACHRSGTRSCGTEPWGTTKLLADNGNILSVALRRSCSISCGSVPPTSERTESEHTVTETASAQLDVEQVMYVPVSVIGESFFDACEASDMATPLGAKATSIEAFFSPISTIGSESDVDESMWDELVFGAIFGGEHNFIISKVIANADLNDDPFVFDSDMTVPSFSLDCVSGAFEQISPADVPVPGTPKGVRSDLCESFDQGEELGFPLVTSYELDLSDQKTESMVTCNEVAPIDQIEESRVEEVSAFDESKVLMPDDFPIVWEAAPIKRRVKKMGFFRRLFCCGASSR